MAGSLGVGSLGVGSVANVPPLSGVGLDGIDSIRQLKPTLDLVFSGTSHGITYTGADNGTYFDIDGVLRTSDSDAPRLDHTFDGTNWIPAGLLIEEQRTNLALRSEELDNVSVWADNDTPVRTANSTGAPDGTTTADTIEDNNGSGYEGIIQTVTVASDTLPYVFSYFIRKDTDQTRFSEIGLLFNGSNRISVHINTETGAIAVEIVDGTTDFGVIDVGDYWRFWVSVTNASLTSPQLHVFPAHGTVLGTANAAATGSAIFWGAQFEQAAFPTSYIPTTTAAVTRTADVATMTDISWFNSNEGTFLFEGSFPYVGTSSNELLDLDDGGNTDRFRLVLDASENINFSTTHSADTDGASNGTGVIAANTVFRVAGAYSDDDIRAAVDGALSPADSTAALPLADAMTTLRFGATIASTNYDGHIRRVRYWPKRLSDLKLQKLSS